MIYGYARVSTKGQERDGNSLESQETKLRENGATIVYHESFTGTKRHRPEFDKLLSVLKEGDTLVVTKLDRIARSVIHGASLMEELISMGVKINVLNMGMMDNTPASKLMRTMFFAFAEFERDMIVERTQEGKAVAKTKEGFKEGRPELEVDPAQFEELHTKIINRVISVTQAANIMCISRSKMYAMVKKMKEGEPLRELCTTNI